MASRRLRHLGFRAVARLTGILPRSWQYAISRRGADAYYLLDRHARENVIANLRGVLGPDASEALVRQEGRSVFRSFGMYLCEFFGYRSLGARFVDEHVLVEGRENLDAALGRGRGVIFCSAHYSNWELGATVVARLGYPITIVAQEHADPRTNELFVQQRRAAGVTVVPTQHGAKGALKALRRNQTVALMGDRPTGGPVIPVRFFGRRTCLPQGPWRIALTSGAALLPTFVYRRFSSNFTLHIGTPIELPHSGALRERMTALAQAWAERVEARLRADPGQWAVFYRVWEDDALQADTDRAPAAASAVGANAGLASAVHAVSHEGKP